VNIGGGFFQTREVLDATHYLRLVLLPSDRFTWAEVLRSEPIGLSDAALLTLFQLVEEDQYLRAAYQYADNHPDQVRLAYFLAWFEPVLTSPQRFNPLYLMDLFLRHRDAFCDQHGQQDLNLRKLHDMALKWNEDTDLGLPGFLDYLERASLEDESEAEAADWHDEGAVQLMSVHRSKGLEFSSVFVSDLRSTGKSGSGPYLYDEGQFGLKYQHPELGDVMTKVYAELAAQEKEKADREELRLMYVALTRARDELVLTSSFKDRPTGWLKHLGQLYDLQGLFEGTTEVDKKGLLIAPKWEPCPPLRVFLY